MSARFILPAPRHYDASRRLARAQVRLLAAMESGRPIEVVTAALRAIGESFLVGWSPRVAVLLWTELIRVGLATAIDCGFCGAIDGIRGVDRLAAL